MINTYYDCLPFATVGTIDWVHMKVILNEIQHFGSHSIESPIESTHYDQPEYQSAIKCIL